MDIRECAMDMSTSIIFQKKLIFRLVWKEVSQLAYLQASKHSFDY